MKKLIIFSTIFFLAAGAIQSQTWQRKLDGFSFWSLTKDLQGRIYAGTSGTPRGIFRSTNGGTSWDTVNNSLTSNVLSIACDSLGNVYACHLSAGLLISTNQGLNWTSIPATTFNSKNTESVICGKNGYVYVGTITGGIFRSTDFGNTFTQTALDGYSIAVLYVDRFNSNIIYAGASATSMNGFYISTDAGLTFGTSTNSKNIFGIAEKSNGNLFTVTTSSPYQFDKSTNGGQNWTSLYSFPSGMRGLCLNLNDKIIAAGGGGVYKSTDDGVSFANLNFAYSSNQVLAYQNKILVAVTSSSNGGVWVCADSTVTGFQNNNTEVPAKFELLQNYPNPFNPISKIKYQIAKMQTENQKVKLTVFDISGKEVAVLVNEEKIPGKYEVTFDGSNFSSGIYIYKLETGNLSISMKMILLK
jgi:photosystem II stability/assembly factor-like uncharacterized protein